MQTKPYWHPLLFLNFQPKVPFPDDRGGGGSRGGGGGGGGGNDGDDDDISHLLGSYCVKVSDLLRVLFIILK